MLWERNRELNSLETSCRTDFEIRIVQSLENNGRTALIVGEFTI